MSWAVAIVGGVVAAGSIVYGATQKSQARKAMKNNKRPFYDIPQSEYDNQALLQSLAGQGLSDPSMQFYKQGSERGMTSAIDAILKGGGDVNDVDRVYDKYLNNMGQVAMLDDQQRLKNVYAYLDQNRRMSDYSDRQFQYNQHGPWADKQQAAAAQAAAGEGYIQQGIATAGSTAGNVAGSFNQKSTLNNYGNNFRMSTPSNVSTGPGVSDYNGGNGVGLTYGNFANNAQNGGGGVGLNYGSYMGQQGMYANSFNSSQYTPSQQMIIQNLLGGN